MKGSSAGFLSSSSGLMECVLPVWRGTRLVQEDQLELRSFELRTDQYGLLRQVVTPVQVESLYASNDYSFITPPPGSSHWADLITAPYADFVHQRIDLSGKIVIDIGAGSTTLATSLIEGPNAADQVIVVDPAVQGESTAKIRVIRDYWSSTCLSMENIPTPNVILSFNCLEHVLDPVAFLNVCYEFLARNRGDLILVFPEVDSQISKGDWNVFLHEHLSYFNLRTASHLLNTSGFEIVSVELTDDTLLFHARPDYSRASIASSTCADSYSFEQFAGASTFFQNRVGEALQSGPVAFVGATNGLNNLLFLSGFAGDPRINLYDSDDFKHGRFLPTVQNPIRSIRDPRLASERLVLISAMTYYEDIRDSLITDFGIPAGRLGAVLP